MRTVHSQIMKLAGRVGSVQELLLKDKCTYKERECLLQIVLNTIQAPFNFSFSDVDSKCTIRTKKPCLPSQNIQELKRAFGHLKKKQNVIKYIKRHLF